MGIIYKEISAVEKHENDTQWSKGDLQRMLYPIRNIRLIKLWLQACACVRQFMLIFNLIYVFELS